MIKLICFDVNGTILDDTNIFLNAINGIFEEFGKPKLPLDILRKRFGQPWTKIYRDEGISENMASDEKLYEIYNKLYINQGTAEILPNLTMILDWLKTKCIKMAIVSTQQNNITIPILERAGIKNYFDIIKGAVNNKAEAIKEVLSELNISPDQSAYVGDQEGDILHAKRAGCISIGFCGGLHDLERLKNKDPNFIIHNYNELKDLPIFKS